MIMLFIKSGLSCTDHEASVSKAAVIALHLFFADEVYDRIIIRKIVGHGFDLIFHCCGIGSVLKHNIAFPKVLVPC